MREGEWVAAAMMEAKLTRREVEAKLASSSLGARLQAMLAADALQLPPK